MQLGLPLEKPISVWNKPLEANFKDLFLGLSKAAIGGASGSWTQLCKETVQALKAVGLKDDPAQLAWLLIRRALTRALFELVQDYRLIFSKQQDLAEDSLMARLDLSLEETDFSLDRAFFDRPEEISLLDQIKAPLQIWLQALGLVEAQARSICNRLGSYFVFALNEEWREDQGAYQPIIDALDTPFTRAGERQKGWSLYNAWLRKQMFEPMFQEPFGLGQIYISPRAYYKEKTKCHQRDMAANGGDKSKRIVVELADEVQAWVTAAEKSDAVRLISGGPGCGKSSFCKFFAAQMSQDPTLRTLFVPLHHFEMTGDLVEAMANFVRYSPYLDHNPLDPDPKQGEARLLVIFDGLDELAMQGRVGLEASRGFVREVQKKVDRFNLNGLRLQALISGREVVVGENVEEFRKPHQILYMLPYFMDKAERDGYTDPKELLVLDQRQEWWSAYGQASGNNYQGLPKNLDKPRFVDISQQPLLNYLLALSYIRDRVVFTEETNLNDIYRDLLAAVYARGWESEKFKPLEGLKQAHFNRVLEEIALAVRHGDGRTASVREINKHCENQRLGGLLRKFREKAEEGVTSLLTAFYFRQAGKRNEGDQTFEFTHKSFGEYLVACRILRGLENMVEELQRREEDPDKGWDEKEALVYWTRLCGPTALDRYLHPFLKNEVALVNNERKVRAWHQALCDLISHVLFHGLPMERLEIPRFQEMERQARNAGEALLVLRDLCARGIGAVSKIKWPSPEAFGNWLYSLQGQRTGSENKLALYSLEFLDLSSCTLYDHDFYSANLSGADLSGADLSGAHLSRAHLSGADLSGADLSGANLSGANLSGAHLSGADLRDTRVTKRQLDSARNITQVQIKAAAIQD